MKTKDRAAILAALPIDERDGPLVVDANDRPFKEGTEVVAGPYSGKVVRVEEDEGRIRVDVSWRGDDAGEWVAGLETYTADPHDAWAEAPDITTWLLEDCEVAP